LTDPSQPPIDPVAAYTEVAAALSGEANVPNGPPPTLSEREVEIARALGEALVPRDVRERTGGAHLDPGQMLADFSLGWPVEYRLGLRASLRFIDYAPIVFQIKPRNATLALTTFTAMDGEDRERVVKKLDEAHSYHARMLFKIAKTLIYALYYGQREVSTKIGYDAAKNKAAAEAFKHARDGTTP
jgi:hypothetical protein